MSVLFVAAQEFPDQSANATRVINLAKLFRSCGEKTFIIGVKYNLKGSLDGEYDGIYYSHVDASDYLSLSKLKRKKYIEHIMLNAMHNIWKKQKFDMIVASNFAFQSINFLLKFAKENNIPLIYNSVEWYQKDNRSFEGLSGKVKFLYNRYGLLIQHVKVGNIIGISSLLTNYYKERKCNVIRIPTIVDRDKYHFVSSNKNNKLIISYAGSPARKDYIGNAIKALLLLTTEERSKLELHLYGVDNQQLLMLGISEEIVNELYGILFAHGRIPYSEVQSKIAAADFTILLRPNLKYANAGFPTKVGESMMCGTPVIANHTSDLKLYIRDGETGIVVANETAEACAAGFRKVLQLDETARNAMRLAARVEAEKSFFYMSYCSEMKKFIKDLKKQ